MKKHLLHLAATLLLGVGLLAASCSKDDAGGQIATNPVFPAKVTPTVEAGMSYTLYFETDRDWELSIPTSGDAAKWFRIQDGTQHVYKLRGGAGKHEVVISAIELADYDSHHTCDVTMSMQGTGGLQSQVVATITIGPIERTMTVRACMIGEDGRFATDPDKETSGLTYLYMPEPTNDVGLLWPEATNGYAMPILIEGNFNWAVKNELPEWIILPSTTGTIGRKTEIRIQTRATDYPVEGATVTLQVGDDQQTFPLQITIPDSRMLFQTTFAAESTFNHKGEVYSGQGGGYTAGNARGTVVYAEGLVSYRFSEKATQWSDPYLTADPEEIKWINVINGWKAGEGSVQSCTYEVGVAANPGDPRHGLVIALPKMLADEITDPNVMVDGTEVREEYKPYIITKITQETDPGPITASADAKWLAKNVFAKFSKIPSADQQYKFLAEELGTKLVYKMIYAKTWSDEDWNLVFATPYASVKCFDYDYWGGGGLKENPTWLSYNKQLNRVQISIPYPQQSLEKEGAVLFYDAEGKVMSAIYFIYNPNEPFPVEGPSFAYPDWAAQQGSTLEELTSGPIYEQYAEYGVPVWHAKFTTEFPNMSMMTGLTMFQSWLGNEESWIECGSDDGNTWSIAFSPNKGTGAYLFYKDGMMMEKALVLVITAEY